MLVEFVLWGPAGLGADTYMDTLCILSNSFFSFFLLTCFLVTSQEIEKLCAGEKRERWPSGRLCWGYEILFELEDHDAYESSGWIVTSRATSSWIITSTIFAAVCSPSTSAFRGDSSLSIPRACTRADQGGVLDRACSP